MITHGELTDYSNQRGKRFFIIEFKLNSSAPCVKTRLKKKITVLRKKEKIFSGTKVQLYIDKGENLLINQCYFGETMQAKDFDDQALKESERQEY